MVEIVLSLSLVLMVVSILTYFFIRERLHRTTDSQTITLLEQHFSKISQEKDILISTLMLEHLKHIANLEKMILPKPVTQKDVQSILDRTPLIVDNDIEKIEDNGIEITEDNLGSIPFSGSTKVIIEGEGDDSIPTQVI